MLVTPSCDVEQEKVDFWTLVALFPDVDVAKAVVAKDLESWNVASGAVVSKGQRQALGKALRNLVEQRLPRYQWVPVGIGDARAHVADFTCITAVPVNEVKTKSRRLATLRSSWREQLPARYAAFMARVGTLDLNDDVLTQTIERLIADVLPK